MDPYKPFLAAFGLAAALFITRAHGDPLSWYEADQLRRYTQSQIEQLRQWTRDALHHCRTAKDFDRCADDVQWKSDQRAAEIMRDYDARAAQMMQDYDRRNPR